MNVSVERKVITFIGTLPDKDKRVLWDHIKRLTEHPSAPGEIKRLKTRKPRWRMHVGSKWTIFSFVEDERVLVDELMTQEQAHKKYGNFV